MAAGCGGTATTTAARSSVASTAPATSTSTITPGVTSAASTSASPPIRPPHRTHRTHRRRRRGPAPGTLPQTAALPSADTHAFRAEMRALWRGVRTDSARAAMPAFFPEAAYVQLKRIGDPQSDWQARLVADYAVDLGAAHQVLGPHPAAARLVGVQVPASFAHWVPPGVCDNGDGYYEVPNARIVYRDAAGIQSFGIASMISWRGVWYVVHLGAVLRPSGGGVVDDPTAGPGVSAYSSTC